MIVNLKLELSSGDTTDDLVWTGIDGYKATLKYRPVKSTLAIESPHFPTIEMPRDNDDSDGVLRMIDIYFGKHLSHAGYIRREEGPVDTCKYLCEFYTPEHWLICMYVKPNTVRESEVGEEPPLYMEDTFVEPGWYSFFNGRLQGKLNREPKRYIALV